MATIRIKLTKQLIESLKQAEEIVIMLDGECETTTTETEGREADFFDCIEQEIEKRKAMGKERTPETYRIASNVLKRFVGSDQLPLNQVTPELMARYQEHMTAGGNDLNTVSFHMRILRAAYNSAVKRGLTTNRHPFSEVYTGAAPTEKRAIDADTVKAMRLLPLDKQRALAFARDMFMFSFFTRGMSFIDMAFLRPTDIADGVLTYKRRKTGQTIAMRWEPQMQEIVDRYHSPGQPYLLPIIRKVNGKERGQMRYQQEKQNRMLRKIAEKLGLRGNLTMYVARHSWASIARKIGVPTDLISQGMGHTSEKTTQIYLKSLGNNRLDESNLNIINAV